MSDYIRQNSVSIDYQLGDSWIILSEIEQSIKRKIESNGTPLRDWNITINYGIKTGLNEAFIISKEKRAELIASDPKSAEIIRPILRGRDIERFHVDFQNLYLINTHNGYVSDNGTTVDAIDINKYPSVKDWLDNGAWNTKPEKGTNIERLTKRTDSGTTPYNLRSLAYMDDIYKQKILFSEMVTSPRFYLDKQGFMINDTVTFISGEDLDVLIQYLNSDIIFNSYRLFYAGGGLGNEGTRIKKTFLNTLPLPRLTELEKDTLINSTDVEECISRILGLTEEESAYLTNQ